MVDHAEELLAAEARAVSATRAARDSVAGPLVVGTWGSTAAGLLAPVVARLAEAFPEVVVTSREVDLDAVSAAVRHGEVDVAFGLDYVDAPIPRDRAVARTLLRAGGVRRGRRARVAARRSLPRPAYGGRRRRAAARPRLDPAAGEHAVRPGAALGPAPPRRRAPGRPRGDRHGRLAAARRCRAGRDADHAADAAARHPDGRRPHDAADGRPAHAADRAALAPRRRAAPAGPGLRRGGARPWSAPCSPPWPGEPAGPRRAHPPRG